ncbi:MAG: DUF6794 domain-containing protein [Flavobacteriaceae bacterium]
MTSKGLKINQDLIFKEVEEVYGVGYYAYNPSDSIYFYFDYDIGISFKLKRIFEDNIEIPYRIEEPYTTDPRYLSSKVIETIIEESDYEDISENEFIDDEYIPKDINEAVHQINTFFTDSIRNEIKSLSENEFSSRAHFSLGMRLRNNWGLWGGSRLAVYFNNIGIFHPDDMSGILLISYHRHINDKDLEIDKQIDYYKKYWLVIQPPDVKDFPKEELGLEFGSGIFYNRNDGTTGVIHVQTNSESDNFWIYDYYFGWKRINKSTEDKLLKLGEINQEIVESIFKK